jgi:hypothetical protein
MRSTFSLTACLAWLLTLSPPSWGQEAEAPPRIAGAVRLAVSPEIDGEVLEDPAWKGVPPTNGFVQNAPFEGQPATEKTDVFIGFTEETLDIGVVCYDREPDRIIVAHERRDASLSETDSFQLILDTYLDRQSGFLFGTNPAGVEYDGQVTGQTGGGISGGNALNLNWDTAWQVEARITEIGWSAEFAIPFRSLRFPREQGRNWGVNFQRNIRRHNETSFWAPLPRQFGITWVSLAGELEGLEPPRQRNLQLTPYVLANGRREGVEGTDTESEGDVGIDLKYGITPSMTLDVTINTDFAQVEADEFQINLDRFNLFFPEKRPFFLENAGLFEVGVPQEVELFFSRRIGLGPNGEAIPINAGARVSGKQGSHNIGVLYMQTEEFEDTIPRNGFGVARYSHDLPNRSSVGAIFTTRDGSGSLSDDDDYNRTYGVDGRWGIGQYGELSGFVAQTDTPGIESDDHAYQLLGRYNSETWSASLGYSEVGEGFNPEVGFLRRKGYRKPEGFLLRRIRPQALWGLQEIRPHVSYRGFWDFEDFQETGFLHMDTHWEWRNGYEVHTGINFTHEGVKEEFEIAPGVFVPPGEYSHEEVALVFWTNRGAPVSFELRPTIGGFFGGDRVAIFSGLNFRTGEKFTNQLSWSHNDIDLPGGAFKTNLGRLRTSYSFTPSIFIQALIQYNDLADIWATNLRFTWLQRANAGFFVVYNEINDIGSAGTGIADRELIIKYSRLIDVWR